MKTEGDSVVLLILALAVSAVAGYFTALAVLRFLGVY